ncbi:MAG: SIS domain-containing protein [Proteiniphilum sp.]|nr:SIS domain-containing protein [Proteiniphilum sp.]MDD4800041.1 SIS domain-containing protein [Proteiniphilum sp.]MDY0182693.1 SIS domain-containing protein [Proteiniphilum sp.]
MKKMIESSLDEALLMLQTFISHPDTIDSIERAASTMATALQNGNKIISCGNGGSLCDATHFAEELTGRYRKNRAPLPAIAINDPAYITCVGNDFSFNDIYARYVEGVGRQGDVLLAISTSGNSTNIMRAADAARKKNITVVGLTCESDNALRAKSDIAICTPLSDFSDRIQEIHIKVIHMLIQSIEYSLNNQTDDRR